MRLYRIAKAQFANDLSGKGAELYGGRWNSPGNKVVYCSNSAALALVETLAWTSLANLLSAGFVLLVIECPVNNLREIALSDLPQGWNMLDAYPVTQGIGDAWLKESSSLLLKVPSAVLPIEMNLLINPLHSMMSQVKIEETFDLLLDPRILKHISSVE